MTGTFDPRHRIVLVSDSGRIPSFYVRFFDPIRLVTENYKALPSYTAGAEQVAADASLLVVHRWLGTQTRMLVDAAKLRGIPIIYETDDNLLELPKNSSMKMSSEHIANIESAILAADLVMCSTTALAEQLARYNRRMVVVDNYGLDKPAVDVRGRPHLAVVNTDYFKLSDSKGGFFSAIADALESLDYKVTFFGSIDAEMSRLRDRFPDAVTIVDDFLDDRSAFLDRLAAHGINVAAVPLDDTDQHLIKSDIKFLDLASLGVPAIFNNKRVYAKVRDHVDGFISHDSQAGWFEGFRYFADVDNRHRCGVAARLVVSSERGIQQYADRLADIYAQLIDETESRRCPVELDRTRSGLFWQSGHLLLLHDGIKRHVPVKRMIAPLLEAGFGFIEPRAEEFASVPSSSGLTKPHQIRGLAPLHRTSTRAPTSPASGRALTIAWIVPGLIIGSGGHRNVIRCAYYLEQLGHRVSLYFIDSQDPCEVVRSQVREHFYPMKGYIGLLEDDFPTSDIVFVTHWTTVKYAERFKDRIGEIVYFVQDFEPFFYAMGSEYVLAETTYRKGFYAITSGIWCEHFLRNSYNAEADHFQFPIDRTIYYDRKASRRHNRVIFFAKPEMPRRCFDIGVRALRAFHALRPDVEIVFYGSSQRVEVDFPCTQLGMLPGPNDLAKLYNGATIGLAFSTTNPSLVPYEMMACGLPVVDLARPGNEMNYDGRFDLALLADPDPDGMARDIAALIADEKQLASRSAHGVAFAGTFPVEEEVGLRIDALIRKRVRAWGEEAERRAGSDNDRVLPAVQTVSED